jgi:hypothetical protein
MKGGLMSEENSAMFAKRAKSISEKSIKSISDLAKELNQRAKELNQRASKGRARFGRVFNNRTNENRAASKRERNEDRFFRELGRPMTKYNTNNKEMWRKKYLERAEKYLNNTNRATGKDRYAMLKRAMRRMNNNLYKTRATLEHTHGPHWDPVNRNNKFDRMFTMTKKQLERIRKQPNDYLENPDDFMMDPEGENTPYIHNINNETKPGWSPSSNEILRVSEHMNHFQ